VTVPKAGIVCDASVAVIWFHEKDEPHSVAARAIARSIGSRLHARVPDLAHLEIAHVLLRKKELPPARVSDALLRLRELTGMPSRLRPEHVDDAIELGAEHGLTVYDASYWALARATGSVLVTLDSALLAAGAGITPAALCEALGLVGP
jgi:predicted nucleic acid-binding protein